MRNAIPRFTAKQAKDIGSCAVIAIANVTGRSWDDVWEIAQYYFGPHGLHSGDKWAILKELGYNCDGFFKLIHWDRLRDIEDKRNTSMTVAQAEKWLNANMPEVTLICSIRVAGQGHAISYRNGRFHNTLGAKKARINLASVISKAA